MNRCRHGRMPLRVFRLDLKCHYHKKNVLVCFVVVVINLKFYYWIAEAWMQTRKYM